MTRKNKKHTTLSLIWDKKLDQNPKLLLCFLILTNFDYIVDYNKLTIKNSILWILIMQLMGTSEA
jgi:hypothetical protein